MSGCRARVEIVKGFFRRDDRAVCDECGWSRLVDSERRKPRVYTTETGQTPGTPRTELEVMQQRHDAENRTPRARLPKHLIPDE